MRDYSSDIGGLFKTYDGNLILVVDVKVYTTSDKTKHFYIEFEDSNGDRYSQGSVGFYKTFDRVS
jgi:hypothetical protein